MLHRYTCVVALPECVFAAVSAPLKLKASRGPPTPINRNQASQPRVGQSLLGKRGFDSVSVQAQFDHTFRKNPLALQCAISF